MQNYHGIFYRNWKKPSSSSERIKFTIEHDLRLTIFPHSKIGITVNCKCISDYLKY